MGCCPESAEASYSWARNRKRRHRVQSECHHRRNPGAFEIPNVQPGKYDLFVSMGHENGSPGPGGGIQAWGRATVEVRDQDVAGVRMTIHPSMDVPGVVKIDGKPAPADGT
jgi:hypothetical protein